MPAAVPQDEADPKFTQNGRFDLQVRGRVASHLENFQRDFMEPGTYSEVEYTPQLDYNVRFYCTHDDFAWAMGKAVAQIDYLKFKPTAEDKDPKTGQPLYKDGALYHDVLNSIWGTVTKLGSPGGIWGSYSKTNKNGYKSYSNSPYEYTGFDGTKKTLTEAYNEGESAFGAVDGSAEVTRGMSFDDMPEVGSTEFDQWWESANQRALAEEDPDYDPEDEKFVIAEADKRWFRDRLLEEASEFGVQVENWPSYFTADEFAVIRDDYREFMNLKRKAAKKARRQRRKARQAALRDSL